MKPVSILLADNHAIVRQGLRKLLEAHSGLNIVGEAGDGIETLRLVEQLRPDVVVLDLVMPGLSGLEVARELRRRSAKSRVVVLSMQENEAYVVEALRFGVSAYVLKQAGIADLVKAIRDAMAGRRFLSAPFSDLAIRCYLQRAKGLPFESQDTLTSRERQVLQLAAEGLTNAAIGKRLFISVRTVEGHRANFMRKLGLHSHIELIRYALNRGLLPHDATLQDPAPTPPPSPPEA